MKNDILTAVIIEDERESLQLLEGLITSNGNARVTGSTSNPLDAVDLITSLNPDIVFLDVKMPVRNGFDVLDDLSRVKSVNARIVFTTAYDEFAVRAFEYAAFDYLLKPIEPERLAATLERCIANGKEPPGQKPNVLLDIQKKLVYRSVSGLVIIDPAEVIYIEADGNYSFFRLIDGRSETITVQIGQIENVLPADKFFRISRTYIINLNFLKKLNTRKRECILSFGGLDVSCVISRDKMKFLLGSLKNR
jgi:two-component system, LytTR family, response regulator